MKKICWIVLFAMLAQFIPCAALAEADDEPKIYLYDDFEGIQVGRHPLYKYGYWSGDSLITNYCGYLDVIKQDGNKKLRIHTKGAGENVGSTGPYIYLNIENVTDDLVVEADIMIEDAKSQVNIWMRGQTGSHLIKICNFQDGIISAENKKICDYVPGKEYHLTAVLHAKKQAMTVSIDDITVENVKTGAPIISSIQFLRFILTGSMEKGVECGFTLDNVRVYKASEKLGESAFANLPQNLGLYDWSDLTTFMKRNITFVKNSTSTAVGTERRDMGQKPYFEGGNVYVPAQFTLENLDIPYTYRDGRLDITVNQKTYKLSIGEGLRLVNGMPYLSLGYMTDLGGLYLTVCGDTAVFGRHLVYFNEDAQAEKIAGYILGREQQAAEDVDWYPSKEQIRADFEAGEAGVHPRVLATKDDFDRIRGLIKTDAAAAAWYADIKKQADAYCEMPPFTFRTTDGLRMDTSVLSRFETMGMVYNVEGGDKYVKKAYEDMATIVQYDDWQPGSFIILAGMLYAMSIGYDWFYNAMTPEQRKPIADGIYRLGLKCGLDCYHREVETGDDSIVTRAKLQWLNDQSNWTAVGNGGMVIGAVALYDEYPQECIESIWYALQSIENFYATTEPDGGCTEGVGYWLYSRIHYTNLVASLQSGLGTDYGRYEAGGINKSGYFPIYLQNEAGVFMFSDTDGYIVNTPIYMYYAMRNGDNGLGYYRKKSLLDRASVPTVYDLLWYREEFADASQDMALDYYARNVESGSFRDTFNNEFSTMLAFHGGANNANHAHNDGGNWMFSAHGERWFVDLGKDNLTYVNTNGVQFTSDQLYRIRAEGHNCVVFNPDESVGQNGIFAQVESFCSTDNGGYAIMDLGDVYSNYVKEYKRGFMLTDNRSRAVVQDKFTTKEPSEFYWFAHTPADIEIMPDGKSAVLTQNGRKLAVYLSSTDPSLKLGKMKAEPLPTSPHIEGSADNSAFSKLYIHGENVTEVELALSLVPIVKGEKIPRSVAGLTPLDSWKIKEVSASYPTIDGIEIDGAKFDDFNSRIFEYLIKLPYEREDIPEIVPRADKAYTVTQENYEDNLRQGRKITVKNEQNGEKKSYYFSFVNMSTSEIPDELNPIKVVAVTASDTPQPEYPAGNVIDGIVENESRWSSLDEQHLIFDLGKTYSVENIALALMNGRDRQSEFEVYTSVDGENYTQVLSAMNSKETDGLELFRLKQTEARYVKVQFHGADISRWNSVKEVKIYGNTLRYTTEKAGFNEDFNTTEEGGLPDSITVFSE